MSIVLMGYRCTGKSSVGRLLADRLGWPLIDTDELIQRRTGRPIPELVAAGGWIAFRAAEAAVIAEVSGAEQRVIALGGGAVLDARNVELLKGNGLFVWLFADVEQIAARMEKDAAGGNSRPSLTGEHVITEIGALMAEREPLYRRLADISIDTTRIPAAQVAEAILAGLRERLSGTERVTDRLGENC